MSPRDIEIVKKAIGYTEPTEQPCRDCRHCFSGFSILRGEDAECGLAARTPEGRFAVHPWATCDRFEIRPHLLEKNK